MLRVKICGQNNLFKLIQLEKAVVYERLEAMLHHKRIK
jgi:hypothetical protein